MGRVNIPLATDEALSAIFKAGKDPVPEPARTTPKVDDKLPVRERRRSQLRAMLREYGFDPEQDAISLGFAVTQMAFVLMDLDEKMERIVKVLEDNGKKCPRD